MKRKVPERPLQQTEVKTSFFPEYLLSGQRHLKQSMSIQLLSTLPYRPPTEKAEKLTSSKFIEYKNRLRTIDEKFNLSYLESSKANQYYEQAQKKYEELNSNKSFAEFFESILTKLEKLTSQKLDRFAFKQGFTIESLVKFDLQGCAKVEAWYNDCYPSGYSSQNSQYQGYDKEQLKKEGWVV